MGILGFFSSSSPAGESSSPSNSSSDDDQDSEDLMERAGITDDGSMPPSSGASTSDSSASRPYKKGSGILSFKIPDTKIDSDSDSSSSDAESNFSPSPIDSEKSQSIGNFWKPPPAGLGDDDDSSSSSSSTTNEEDGKPKTINDVWKAPEVPPHPVHEAPSSPSPSVSVSVSSASSSSVEERKDHASPDGNAKVPSTGNVWKQPAAGLGDDDDSSSSSSSKTNEDDGKPKISAPSPESSGSETDGSEPKQDPASSGNRRPPETPDSVSESSGSSSSASAEQTSSRVDGNNLEAQNSSSTESSGVRPPAPSRSGENEGSSSPSGSSESTLSKMAKQMIPQSEKDRMLPKSGDEPSDESSEESEIVEKQPSGTERNSLDNEHQTPISSQMADMSSAPESSDPKDPKGPEKETNLNPLQRLEERRKLLALKSLAARKEVRSAQNAANAESKTSPKKDFRSLIQRKQSLEETATDEKGFEDKQWEGSGSDGGSPAGGRAGKGASSPPAFVKGETETTTWSRDIRAKETSENAATPMNQDSYERFGWSPDAKEGFGWMPPVRPALTTYGQPKIPATKGFYANVAPKPDPPLASQTAWANNMIERTLKSPNSSKPERSDVGVVYKGTMKSALNTKPPNSAIVTRKQNYSAPPPVTEISVFPEADDESTLGTDGLFYSPTAYQSNAKIRRLQGPNAKADTMLKGRSGRDADKYYESWTGRVNDSTSNEQEDPPGTRNKGGNFDNQAMIAHPHISGTRNAASPTTANLGLSFKTNTSAEIEGSDDSWVPVQVKSQLTDAVLLNNSKSNASSSHWLPDGITPKTVRLTSGPTIEESTSEKPRSSRSDSDGSQSNWNPRPGSTPVHYSGVTNTTPTYNKKSAKVVQPSREDYSSTSRSSSYSYEVEDKVTSLGKTNNFNPVSNTKAAMGIDSGQESLSLGDLPSHASQSSDGWDLPSQASQSSDARELSSAWASSSSSSPSAGFSSKHSQPKSKGNARGKDSKDLEKQTPSSDSDGNSKNRRALRWVIIAVIVVSLLLIGGVVAFVLTRDADSNPSTASGSPPTFTPITPFPTERPVNPPTFPPVPPSPSPVPSPTAAPGDPDLVDDEYYQLIVAAYPDGGMALQNRASPQRTAFEWLRSPSNLEDLSEDRILQRYALATFFYSTKGWEWTVASRWLSNEHECSWFSTSNSIEVCNPNKEYTELSLRKNNLGGTIPIEVFVLLESLGKLGYKKWIRCVV
jgi:hypothetical protein